MKHFQILLLSSLIVFLGCDDDVKTVTHSLEFSAMANGSPLIFNTEKYEVQEGQAVTFDRMNLYISNVIFSDGDRQFIEPDSYHLLTFDNNQNVTSFDVSDVPGDLRISSVTFSIGVDPELNSRADNVGDLDPVGGMVWDWNTGYKFFLLEGEVYINDENTGGLIMHIGTDNNYFTHNYQVENSANMSFEVNALAPFSNIDLSTLR